MMGTAVCLHQEPEVHSLDTLTIVDAHHGVTKLQRNWWQAGRTRAVFPSPAAAMSCRAFGGGGGVQTLDQEAGVPGPPPCLLLWLCGKSLLCLWGFLPGDKLLSPAAGLLQGLNKMKQIGLPTSGAVSSSCSSTLPQPPAVMPSSSPSLVKSSCSSSSSS